MALTPPPLGVGSTLAAVSPAGPIRAAGFEKGRLALEAEKFKIIRMPSALLRSDYLAGSDRERADDLNEAFANDRFNGIICTRGGYGAMRILPYLDFSLPAKYPKALIGFSDISALQWALWQKSGLVTFSGPQLVKGWGEGLSDFSRKCWLDALGGSIWDKPMPLPVSSKGKNALETIRSGKAEGALLGGNLAVLTALAGTTFAPDFSGGILVLEEIDEPAYRIDRMLTQLHLSGALEGVRGVILGRFEQRTEDGVVDLSGLAGSLLASMIPNGPVVIRAPYGHSDPCWTLPLGARAELDGDRGILVLHKPS